MLTSDSGLDPGYSYEYAENDEVGVVWPELADGVMDTSFIGDFVPPFAALFAASFDMILLQSNRRGCLQ
jgi:hypothetical protein